MLMGGDCRGAVEGTSAVAVAPGTTRTTRQLHTDGRCLGATPRT